MCVRQNSRPAFTSFGKEINKFFLEASLSLNAFCILCSFHPDIDSNSCAFAHVCSGVYVQLVTDASAVRGHLWVSPLYHMLLLNSHPRESRAQGV